MPDASNLDILVGSVLSIIVAALTGFVFVWYGAGASSIASLPPSTNSLSSNIWERRKSRFGFFVKFLIVFLVITYYGALLVDDRLASKIYVHWGYEILSVSLLFPCLLFSYDIARNWIGVSQPEDPNDYYIVFLNRANRLEREATLILIGIFGLIIGAAIVFFKADYFAQDDINTLYGQSIISRLIIKTVGVHVFVNDLYPVLFLTGLRIGDVAVASFLTFMLVRIYRYNLRLSAFFLSRADTIKLHAGGPFKKVDIEILPVLLDANFDFGGDHPSLVDGFAKLIEALNPRKKAADPQEN